MELTICSSKFIIIYLSIILTIGTFEHYFISFVIDRMWTETGKVIFKYSDPNDIELLESATAALRAALQKLVESRTDMFQQLSIADLEPMLNGERQCANANVRVNLIRTLGNLALILVNGKATNSHALVKVTFNSSLLKN